MNSKRLVFLSAILSLLAASSSRSQAQSAVQKQVLSQKLLIEESLDPATTQFSSDGNVFAYSITDPNTTTFHAIDVRRFKTIASWKLRHLTDFAISPDGREVATISGERQRYGVGYGYAVEVRDLRTDAKKRTLVPTGSIDSAFYAVAWSQNGAKIALGGGDGQVRVFDLRTEEQQDYAAPGFINDLAFSPDGRFLAAGSGTYSDKISVFLWTLSTGRVTRLRYTDKLLQTVSLTFSRNSKRLFTRRIIQNFNSRNPGIVIYALPSLAQILSIEAPLDEGRPVSPRIALSQRGDRFAFADGIKVLGGNFQRRIKVSVGDSKNNRIVKSYQLPADVDGQKRIVALSFARADELRWVTSTFNGKKYRLTLWKAGAQR